MSDGVEKKLEGQPSEEPSKKVADELLVAAVREALNAQKEAGELRGEATAELTEEQKAEIDARLGPNFLERLFSGKLKDELELRNSEKGETKER